MMTAAPGNIELPTIFISVFLFRHRNGAASAFVDGNYTKRARRAIYINTPLQHPLLLHSRGGEKVEDKVVTRQRAPPPPFFPSLTKSLHFISESRVATSFLQKLLLHPVQSVYKGVDWRKKYLDFLPWFLSSMECIGVNFFARDREFVEKIHFELFTGKTKRKTFDKSSLIRSVLRGFEFHGIAVKRAAADASVLFHRVIGECKFLFHCKYIEFLFFFFIFGMAEKKIPDEWLLSSAAGTRHSNFFKPSWWIKKNKSSQRMQEKYFPMARLCHFTL